MKFMKNIISKLYFKYCFNQSSLSNHIMTYYVPTLMKDGCPVTGTYIFGIINETIQDDIGVWWTPLAGYTRGKITPLTDVTFNYENMKNQL